MTRINVVPPSELSDRHLIAEYRELPRVFGLIFKRQEKGHTPEGCNIPSEYCLGKGHVTFFYDKVIWLTLRYKCLVIEMRSRGFNPKYTLVNPIVDTLGDEWWNYYTPTFKALALNRQRIKERTNS